MRLSRAREIQTQESRAAPEELEGLTELRIQVRGQFYFAEELAGDSGLRISKGQVSLA